MRRAVDVGVRLALPTLADRATLAAAELRMPCAVPEHPFRPGMIESWIRQSEDVPQKPRTGFPGASTGQTPMTVERDSGRYDMPEPIIYIDRSDIREGKLEEVRAAAHELAGFVEQHEPQLVSYGFYIDEEAGQMIVVAMHPDVASMEFHLQIGDSAFRKFAELISLRGIEVYGQPSDTIRNQLHQKAEMLGEGGSVVVHERHAGFIRLPSPAS